MLSFKITHNTKLCYQGGVCDAPVCLLLQTILFYTAPPRINSLTRFCTEQCTDSKRGLVLTDSPVLATYSSVSLLVSACSVEIAVADIEGKLARAGGYLKLRQMSHLLGILLDSLEFWTKYKKVCSSVPISSSEWVKKPNELCERFG